MRLSFFWAISLVCLTLQAQHSSSGALPVKKNMGVSQLKLLLEDRKKEYRKNSEAYSERLDSILTLINKKQHVKENNLGRN